MNVVIRAIERLSTTVGFIGAWALAPLILSMVYEVIARHVFDAPTFWAYEVGYMLAGTCFMFGMAYCLKVKGHVRVDFIYDQLSARGQALIDSLGYLFLLLPGGIWVSFGLFEYAKEAYDFGEVSGESAWNPVIWPFRAIWFIGFSVLILQAIGELIIALHTVFTGPTSSNTGTAVAEELSQ